MGLAEQIRVILQELLECTYEEQYGYDGCGGGWYYDAFDRVVNKGHLSTSEDLRFFCRLITALDSFL